MVRSAVQLLAADLELFGGAGGKGHMHDLLRVQPHLFGKIGLDRGPLYADGALCGGEVGQQLGGVHLGKVGPAGAAAGEQGQGPVLFGDAADQLTGLLHDGQVGGKVGVQHVVGTQSTQQRHHFAFHKGAGLHAEFLA